MGRISARILTYLLVAFTFLVSGCAGTVKNMGVVPAGRVVTAPAEGKALVVFMRPSTLGFAVQSSVFEANDASSTLVGIVAAQAKVAYMTEPGKHLFMVVGESADFMYADLLPNKTYYALVTPRMGMWKARFSLQPIHQQERTSAQFTKWSDSCKWVEKTAESDRWASQNMNSIQAKYTEYYKKWMSKPEAERPVLAPEDGI